MPGPPRVRPGHPLTTMVLKKASGFQMGEMSEGYVGIVDDQPGSVARLCSAVAQPFEEGPVGRVEQRAVRVEGAVLDGDGDLADTLPLSAEQAGKLVVARLARYRCGAGKRARTKPVSPPAVHGSARSRPGRHRRCCGSCPGCGRDTRGWSTAGRWDR